MSVVNKPVDVRQLPDYLAEAIEKLREESELVGAAKQSLPMYLASQAKEANAAAQKLKAAIWKALDEEFAAGYKTANGGE